MHTHLPKLHQLRADQGTPFATVPDLCLVELQHFETAGGGLWMLEVLVRQSSAWPGRCTVAMCRQILKVPSLLKVNEIIARVDTAHSSYTNCLYLCVQRMSPQLVLPP